MRNPTPSFDHTSDFSQILSRNSLGFSYLFLFVFCFAGALSSLFLCIFFHRCSSKKGTSSSKFSTSLFSLSWFAARRDSVLFSFSLFSISSSLIQQPIFGRKIPEECNLSPELSFSPSLSLSLSAGASRKKKEKNKKEEEGKKRKEGKKEKENDICF
jgi:hypothetical protein